MKTKISILIFFIGLSLLNTLSNAQGVWTQQYPINSNEQMEDIFCLPNSTMAWAAGDLGFIMRTVDGNSWTSIISGTKNWLASIYFVDKNIGWTVGQYGTILKSNNGGYSWIPQTSSTSDNLNSVHFVNQYTGWAVGNNVMTHTSVVLKTTNGGNTWTVQSIPGVMLRRILFINSNIGWTIGYQVGSGGNKIIMKTIDGGTNWTSQNVGTTNDITSFYFIDASIGWIVGTNGTILKTTDGGATWVAQTSGVTNVLCDIFIIDANTGWIVCDNGSILKTTNGGINWNAQTSGITNYLFNVCFSDANRGWVVGNGGLILGTTNGGTTWTPLNGTLPDDLKSVHFVDSKTGFAVGGSGGYLSWHSGVVMKTIDGGNIWNNLINAYTYGFNSTYFVNSSIGWVVGANGTILRTTNGGSSWTSQTSGITKNLLGVFFIDVSNGWVVGETGTILRTTNSGVNWTAQNSGITDNCTGLYFIDINRGWVVTSGIYTILKTSNGGTTWVNSSFPGYTLLSVYFANSNKGWIAGDGIYKTTNGGSSWSKINNTPNNSKLSSVYFSDEYNGWAVGENDIIKTSDGGNTWKAEIKPTGHWLKSVCFIKNSKTGWAVGGYGSIFHYSDFSPDVQAKNITATPTYQSIIVQWERGNGNQSAVFAKKAINNSNNCLPSGNTTYLPNSTFGMGDQISSSGWFCVYNGTSNSVTVSGLEASTDYTFQVFEYNFGPDFTHYNSTTATNNPLTVTTAIAPPQITGNPVDKTLCETLNTTFSVTASGTGLTYQWQVDAGSGYLNVTNGGVYSGSTSSTLSLTGTLASLNANKYHCVVSNTSGSATSGEALLTVNPLPVTPGDITGNQIVCLNSNYTFIVPPIQFASSYQWTFPSGFSGNSTTNSINLATVSNAVAGIISVKGVNSCGTGPVKNFNVSVKNLPGNASQITGLNSVCTGSINIGYSTATISDAENYVWSLPFGATGSSTINSIMVNYGSNPLTGQITVKGHNMCGDGIQSVLPVSVNTVPAAIGTISGSSNVCKNQKDVLYTINTIPNATSYAWTLPPGVTGSNSTNSVSLNIGPDAFSGDLKVSGVNSCGIGVEIVFPVIVDAVPDALGPISGSSIVCIGQTNVQYSVAKSDRASSYIWELPDGSSDTTITNKIVLNFNTTSTSGNIFVTPHNSCGNGNSSNLYVQVSQPPLPSISALGATEFCSGDSVRLSIESINGMSYQWLKDGGTVGNNANFYAAKVTGNYTINITNAIGCTASALNSINVIVNSVPQVSAVNISGLTSFCQGGSVELSVTNNLNYSYQWKNNQTNVTGALTNTYIAQSTGIYSLYISNSDGCVTKTSPVSVLVKPMPLKPVITSDNYQPGKCLRDTPLRLNVNQGVSGYIYSWYKNGVPVSNSTSSFLEGFLSGGDYSVEADLNGCKLQSDIYNVFFADAPEKPFIYAQGPTVWYLACSNDSASQYKWYYNGNLIPEADEYLYVANRNLGNYYVSIANSKGCFTASDIIKIPSGATGIDDVDPFKGLKIYPNPTPGLFNIEMDNQIFGELNIKIFTQEGKSILKVKFEKTTEHFSSQIDLSGQAKGLYLINIILDKYFSNNKIIIE
jgi:photosystem II stability/assembly factor-like uncharacterized protein